ncbi:uncharacterized protein LOC142350276 [Convolutriloba macropyga]|uniref:uncharacterized protein LOC142350276 n=1 Tax=Convolutriloba macropyga TaxID=536237 RepID=UPI003F52259E
MPEDPNIDSNQSTSPQKRPTTYSNNTNPFRDINPPLQTINRPIINDSSRKRPLYMVSYVIKIMFLLLVICGILSLIYPFLKTAFRQSELIGGSVNGVTDAEVIRNNIRWHHFVTTNLSDVICPGDLWSGSFVQPTGPVPFNVLILHSSHNLHTHSTLFTGLFYNDYFNMTISGDYMTAEQGYLVMYYSSLNPNPNQIPMDPTSSVNNPAQFIGGGERALSSWRADAYVSIFNHTIIEFRGHMQPTTLFGPFQMQSDNVTLEYPFYDIFHHHHNQNSEEPYPMYTDDSLINKDQQNNNHAHDDEVYSLEGMGDFRGGSTRGVIQFRRGQREVVGVLIGISIPVLLVLFALLAIITNHFRKLCCSSDSSIAFQKFNNPWNFTAGSDSFTNGRFGGQLSASSSAYDTTYSYMTQSTSTGVLSGFGGGGLSRSCTLQDNFSALIAAETDLDDNLEVQLHPNKIQIRQNEHVQIMEMKPMRNTVAHCSASSSNHNSEENDVIELHNLPRMNTNDRLKVLFSDDVREIPCSPANTSYDIPLDE